MTRLSITARTLTVIALIGLAGCRSVGQPAMVTHASQPPAAAPAAAARLTNGAASVDGLVDEFLKAVEEKNWQDLERLRVSEAEYRSLILPGSVAPGQPPKVYPDQPSKYFWDVMNTKSQYWLRSIVAGFGGHKLTRKEIHYAKGVQDYASYRAYKKLVVTVADETGREADLHTGSIAEVNGQYKFISFLGTD